jgi:hypothetical protein
MKWINVAAAVVSANYGALQDIFAWGQQRLYASRIGEKYFQFVGTGGPLPTLIGTRGAACGRLGQARFISSRDASD